MSSGSAVVPEQVRPWSPGARWGTWAALGFALLALLETAQAIVAPRQAASGQDWQAAAVELRRGFRSGDLIVAAPAWADPLMRMYVGDLLPIAAAARMDDARFGRVWVISQKQAQAPEEAGRARTFEGHFGALTLRRMEGAPQVVTYDFLEQWRAATVFLWNPVTRLRSPCLWGREDSFVCAPSGNTVRRMLVEVEQQIKRAILAPPVAGAVVAVEFPSVVLGRELVVAAGLHDTWARKSPGSVTFEIWIDGQRMRSMVVDNRSGWHPLHLDTSARLGQTVPVRFQVSSLQPALRNLAFAAEARR